MSDALDDTIQDAAENPAEATIDGNTVRRQPLRDLIEADRYLTGKRAGARSGFPLRLMRLQPPGAGD
jgi:hypothetical protein